MTANGDSALTAAGGIGWVDGVTYERSPKENVEAVRMLLDLGLDPNHANNEGRTPLMGAALKGRPDVIQLLVDRGAKLETRDRGSRDTHIPGAHDRRRDVPGDRLRRGAGARRRPVGGRASRGRRRCIRKLMQERGLPVPAPRPHAELDLRGAALPGLPQ